MVIVNEKEATLNNNNNNNQKLEYYMGKEMKKLISR